MSTFYVLPARPVMGDHLARVLQEFFPGFDWNLAERVRLAELVGALMAEREGIFIVHREDLPGQESLSRALIDGYGAEPGDEIVEIRPSGELASRILMHSRRWPVTCSVRSESA